MAGSSFEWTPDTVGEIPYFCMVHPWMQGLIIVQEVGAEEEEAHDENPKRNAIKVRFINKLFIFFLLIKYICLKLQNNYLRNLIIYQFF